MAKGNVVSIQLPLAGRGVNLLTDPTALQDDELKWAQNAFPIVPGKLMKRPAIRPTAFPALAGTGIVVAAHAAPASQDYDFVTVRKPYNQERTCYEAWRGGRQIITQNFTNDTYLVNGSRPCIFDVRGHLLILPGAGTKGEAGFLAIVPSTDLIPSAFASPANTHQMINWDFTSAGAGGTGQLPLRTQSKKIYPKVGCTYKGSAVFGNLGVGYEKALLYADWGNQYPVGYNAGSLGYYPQYGTVFNDALSLNGGYLTLNGGEGSRIVGMVEVALSQSGALMETAVLVLSEYDAWICTGHPLNSWDLNVSGNPLYGDFKPNLLSYQVGCASQETITRTPYGVFWASADDVWFMATGGLPVRVGSKIRPRLQAVPSGFQWAWYGVYDPVGVFRLGIATEASATAAFGSYPYEIPVFEEWWLDLRGGVPQNSENAQWWGPMTLNPVADKAGNTGRCSPAFSTSKKRVQQIVESSGQTINDYGVIQQLNKTIVTDQSQCVGDSTIDAASDSKVDSAAPIALSAIKWQASTAFTTGDIVRPTNTFGGYWYVCVSSDPTSNTNTTRATEPVWPETPGGSVQDGGAGAVYTMTWYECGLYFMTPNQLGAPGATNPNEIQAVVQSKEMSLDDMFNKKMLIDALVAARAAPAQKLTVNFVEDIGSRTEVTTALVNTPTASESTILGSSKVQTALGPTLSGQLVPRAFRASEASRINFASAYLELKDSNGFVIDDTNNKLFISIIDTTLYVSPYTTKSAVGGWVITIPRGYYATLAALFDALTALGGPFETMVNVAVNETLLTPGIQIVDPGGVIAAKPWGAGAQSLVYGGMFNNNNAINQSHYFKFALNGSPSSDFATGRYRFGISNNTSGGVISAADQTVIQNLMSILNYPSDEDSVAKAQGTLEARLFAQHRSVTNPSQLTLQQAIVKVEMAQTPTFANKQTL